MQRAIPSRAVPKDSLVVLRHFPRGSVASLALPLCLAMFVATSHAAVFEWSGASPVSNSWSTSSNWIGVSAPPDDGTADIVIQSFLRPNSIVDMPWSINSLTFDGAFAHSVSGDALTIGGSTAMRNAGSGANTVNAGIVVDPANSSQSWIVDDGQLIVVGPISGAAGNQIVKSGEGELVLGGTAANTFAGTVAVPEGTLQLAKSTPDAAVFGNLSVGQTFPGTSAIVTWSADEQIAHVGGGSVVVNRFGTLLLNGHDESLHLLAVTGNVETGAGTLTVADRLQLGGGHVDATGGSLVLESTLNTVSSSTTAVILGNLDMASAQITFDVVNGVADIDLSVDAAITDVASGSSQLRKAGNGVLRLRGDNTYRGGTALLEGTLLVDNTAGSATGSGEVVVFSGATLAGAGKISGPVLVSAGGTVTPGGSTGTLGVGNLTLDDEATVAIELGGTQQGIDSDFLDVDGIAVLGGTLDVTLIDDFVPSPSDSFTILTADTVNGAFANAATSIATLDGTFQVTYTPTSVILGSFQSILPGDFNNDGTVDAADYVVWRRDPASHGGDPDGYNTWRAHFGQTAGGASAGSSATLSPAVPEPDSLWLWVLARILLATRRRED